jgi:hypothetical protein
VDVLALILACSLHSDDALVRTLVDVQSGANTYFVGDLSTLKTHDSLASAAEALRTAEDIANHGGRPAVGLLGIPLDWAARFGRHPRDLFDGCTNIAIGTAMLSEFDAACSPQARARAPAAKARRPGTLARRSPRPSAVVRACVLARFARELGVQGAPAEILTRTDVRSPEGPPAAPAQSSAIFGDGIDDAQTLPVEWSDQRMYLDAGDLARGASSPAAPAPPAQRPTAAPATPSPPHLSWPTPRGLRSIPIVPRALPRAATAAGAAPAPQDR